MNLINGTYRGKARFALAPDGTLFDYVTSRYIQIVAGMPHWKAIDGVWDLPKVKVALETGKPLEDCMTGPADKVEVANQDFSNAVDTSTLTPFERAQRAQAAKKAGK